MRSSDTPESAAGRLSAGLDALAATDVVELDDEALREQLLDLMTAHNRTFAEIVRRLDVFDRRGLSEPDGFRTSKAWLQALGRVSGTVAHRLVKVARSLRGLPKLATATQAGEVSNEHLQQVATLVDQVGADRVAEVEPTLTDAASQLDPGGFATVCARVRAHLDPDGPDPARDFARRGLTLSPISGMMAIRGQLDAEGGAALTTALDALMTPPVEGDDRTPAMRRADALVELARLHLAAGDLPTVGGQRPQVGVLLYPQALSPQTLARLAEAQQNSYGAARLREFIADTETPDSETPESETPGTETPDCEAGDGSAATAVPAAWSRPGWADPPWLDWVGPIPPEVAQRIACDADIWRVILDPASGMPLDVGRAHRLVPYWIRKALYARDRGCRWTGCTAPAQWTDAHHLDPWADLGETEIDRLCLLCRYHHCLVHEGGWSIDLDPATGEVTITRPGGLPYLLPRARSTSWNGPTAR
jgi:hypothetical protein